MRQTVNSRILELGDFFKKMETAACVKQESGKLLQKSRTANQPGFVNFNDKLLMRYQIILPGKRVLPKADQICSTLTEGRGRNARCPLISEAVARGAS